MKILLTLFFLFFSSFVASEDISDFEIEGMSIGDSLLDYLSEGIISNSIIPYFENERQYYVVGIYSNLNTYDALEIYLSTNDKNYEIKTIAGKLIIENKKQCLNLKYDLTADIAFLFKNKKKHDDTKNPEYDNSGESKQYISQFNIDGWSTHVRVECVIFSTEIKKNHGYEDSLNVVAMDEEITEWIVNGYK